MLQTYQLLVTITMLSQCWSQKHELLETAAAAMAVAEIAIAVAEIVIAVSEIAAAVAEIAIAVTAVAIVAAIAAAIVAAIAAVAAAAAAAIMTMTKTARMWQQQQLQLLCSQVNWQQIAAVAAKQWQK